MDPTDPQVVRTATSLGSSLSPVLDAVDVGRVLAAVTVALEVPVPTRRPATASRPEGDSSGLGASADWSLGPLVVERRPAALIDDGRTRLGPALVDEFFGYGPDV